MNIGIDARLILQSGVGRYIRNLIKELSILDKENYYYIFLNDDAFDNYKLPNHRWQKIAVNIPWHTLKEQFLMPKIFNDYQLDLVHIPYFNLPLFYQKKYLVTIHDLTVMHVDTGRATTLPKPIYLLKKLGLYILLYVGMRRASRILTVSQTSKNEIIDHFKIAPNRISVTYEGIDQQLIDYFKQEKSKKPIIDKPYFLYVGNAYPHKNLEFLISTFKKFTAQNSKYSLVLVGKKDIFYQKIELSLQNYSDKEKIIFFGETDDRSLANLYINAINFIFPSLMEGFGLPAFEALIAGKNVLVSDIPIFRELLENNAIYFNPNSEKSLLSALQNSVKISEYQSLNKYIIPDKFNYQEMAKQTLTIYQKIIARI
jgi:glycosyltransferase involved in cell wall biosynthesis